MSKPNELVESTLDLLHPKILVREPLNGWLRVRHVHWLTDFLESVRDTVRSLRRAPGLAA